MYEKGLINFLNGGGEDEAKYSFPFTVMGNGQPTTVWVTMYDQPIPWLEDTSYFRKKVIFSELDGSYFNLMPKRFIRSLASEILFPLGWIKDFYWPESGNGNPEIRYFQQLAEKKYQEIFVGDSFERFGDIFIKEI